MKRKTKHSETEPIVPPQNGYRWCLKYKRRIHAQSCGIHRRDTKCPSTCEWNKEDK